MKKLRITLLALCAGIFLGCFATPAMDVNAASKSKEKAQKVVSEDEILLTQLIQYRDMLVGAGASQAEIDNANNAIVAQQYQMALKAQVAAQQAAQAAILSSYQATVDAMMSGKVKNNTNGVVFVGDSRFVMMHQAMGETGVMYVAQGWMGYDWLVETAIPKLDPCVGPGVRVVINLGVNDLENKDKYIAKVNELAALWGARGAKIYYATVNPAGPGARQSEYQINEFNNALRNRLVGVNILETNGFLKYVGYNLVDEVHYDGPTSAKVYYYIMNNI